MKSAQGLGNSQVKSAKAEHEMPLAPVNYLMYLDVVHVGWEGEQVCSPQPAPFVSLRYELRLGCGY